MATHPLPPPPDERDILESKLATLTALQREALEGAQFVPMTADERRQFEQRAHRITEIRVSLGMEVHMPDPNPGRGRGGVRR